MRRYQKWLSAGLLALTPGIALAGPLNSPVLQQSTSSNAPSAAKAAPKAKPTANQQLAEKVAKALKKAKLSGYDIDIKVTNGVATLDGMVGSAEQRAAASKAAGTVSGIAKVNNRLGVADPKAKGPVQQAIATAPPRATGRTEPVRPANFQRGYEGVEPIQQSMPPAVMPPAGMPPEGMNPAVAPPPAPGGIPSYGQPMSGASHVIYNQPNFPSNAWPTYAQYPNYAAVTYPSQYAASAWPYIGPFYPYPQVPLGWRKATLEWDDGYWNLNFRARTDRWWWFLDPKNW
ncbi:MAG TPA: BON domain-containing protein [Planctomycetaceae bacterium]|nr:BON domain-containing protein [Planctomycetaceae bacterium]